MIRIQFLRKSYELQACCLSPQNHCQRFCFVMKGRVQVFWKAKLLSSASSLFEGSRSQVSIDDDTTMMKGGDHHEGQLQWGT